MQTHDVKEILIDKTTIARRVDELVDDIAASSASKNLIVVGILQGSFMFLADLMRSITVPVHIDFMAITSFERGGRPGGVVRIIKDLDLQVSGRDILLVEDIIDTGLTAGYLVKTLEAREPRSLQICTLLDRRVRRLAQLPLQYVGFDVPDQYLVGYGLDHRQIYRNLPFLALRPDDEPPARVIHEHP